MSPAGAAEIDVENLTALSAAQLDALGALQVTARQEEMGGAFAESLAAWQAGPRDRVLGYCFLRGTAPVGMTLFKRPPLSPDWAPEDAASIHGLKIALPWQGRGWGHAAFRLAIARLRQDWPDIQRLILAVDAENSAALAVYRRFGMADSGPIYQGRVGREHHLEMAL